MGNLRRIGYKRVASWVPNSPPPVDPHVGRAREPGVQDVDAADGVGPLDDLPQRRVVVEPKPLAEPVHGVDPIFFLLLLVTPARREEREAGHRGSGGRTSSGGSRRRRAGLGAHAEPKPGAVVEGGPPREGGCGWRCGRGP
ncbi:hypothetical protein JRQ81_015217 [Phrynocephalus forsythii]|uniref:Uncharacterized protein n=1 Tax=Phrynocephalus forsythii TaxID=171643 RepID=A0A9Q1B1S7_9SAUR|nr:hypothetical protein JRQ81_015217 [Phrynocephalus forsythii]